MKQFAILIFGVIVFCSCQTHSTSKKVIIEGNVKNLPDGKVYLTEAHASQIPLDSTIAKNGHFRFEIDDSAFVPYMASIKYPDNKSRVGSSPLFFANEFVLPPDTSKTYNYYNTGFYLEPGKTVISDQDHLKQKFQSGIPVKINAGKETELMYRNQSTDFGWIGNLASEKRQARIRFFKKTIAKNPYSYFLLSGIYNAKPQYSENELRELFSLFNEDVQQSPAGNLMRTYLANRPDPGAAYPNLSLQTPDEKRENIIDPNAKVNMLVFWASWCGPCRAEIPELKEMAAKYEGEGLNMVSISLDEEKDNWQKALAQEKMGWRQLLVDKENLEQARQQFNAYIIPLVVLTDATGKEITKFSGYEKGNTMAYQAVIDKYLQ